MRHVLWRVGLIAALLVTSAKAPLIGQPPPPAADNARTLLREILSTPEFARASGPDPWAELVARVRAWLLDLLSLIGFGGSSHTGIVSTLAWGVALLAVVVLLYLLFRFKRRGRSAVSSGFTAPAVRATSREWLDRVAAAIAAGDAREAIRAAHMAAIMRLEEQGLWRVDESRTPREYLRLLPPSDRRRQSLVELTGEFERSWYGDKQADSRHVWQWLEGCGCPAARQTAI